MPGGGAWGGYRGQVGTGARGHEQLEARRPRGSVEQKESAQVEWLASWPVDKGCNVRGLNGRDASPVAGGSPRWQVAEHVLPTAYRQPLPPVTGRVGTASRHRCLEVGLSGLAQPVGMR